MKVVQSVPDLIGNTPMLLASRYCSAAGISGITLLGKLEGFNPAGSVKDRTALHMIRDAEDKGLIKPGATIIEPTSGNSGIGLACVAAARGYKALIVLPDTMSTERRNLLKAYGADIVLTDGTKGMPAAIETANRLAGEIEGSYLLGQFDKASNPEAHYLTTGPEIWDQTDGKIDILVSTVGTGGTISGAGRYLKEKNPNIKVIAVEPASSPILSKGYGGTHKIQGIGVGFVPETLDTSVYDEVIAVADEDAFAEGRLFATSEGLLVGMSSGAALTAVKALAKRKENEGKIVVAVLPDSGDRYLSTELYS